MSVTRQQNVKRTTKGQKRKRSTSEKEPEPTKGSAVKFKTRRPSVITRVVGRKKTAAERKPYYDEKDKAALRLMRKLRVDWSSGINQSEAFIYHPASISTNENTVFV